VVTLKRDVTVNVMQGFDLAVVIPAFNVRETIDRALRSVLDQDPRPERVIVVDDGSTDGTADAVKERGDVVVIRQQNRGPGAARNAGAASCTNRWIFFLDADDELVPGSLRSLGRLLEDFPDAGAAVANRFLVDAGTGIEEVLWPALKAVEVLDRKDVAGLIRKNDLGMDAAVRQDVWERFPFREDLRASEDQAFWIDLLVAGVSVLKHPEVLLRYEAARPGSASTRTRFMRTHRYRLLRELSRRPELTKAERMLAMWMSLRSGVGALVAR